MEHGANDSEATASKVRLHAIGDIRRSVPSAAERLARARALTLEVADIRAILGTSRPVVSPSRHKG